MAYDLLLIDEDGEEYPYCEELDEGYFYRVSVVYQDNDGELQISEEGVNVILDTGEWIDFSVPPPRKLFPEKTKLSEKDLLRLMDFMTSEKIMTRTYTQNEMNHAYDKFLNEERTEQDH